jgi:hypothetical protein
LVKIGVTYFDNGNSLKQFIFLQNIAYAVLAGKTVAEVFGSKQKDIL